MERDGRPGERRLDGDNRFVHAAVRAVAAGVALPAPPAGTSWMRRAGQHGVLAVLAAHLDPIAREELRPVRQLRAAQHLRTMADLRVLQAALAGIDWLVFKGPVMSEVVYQRPGTRNYGDLDVLVRPGDVDAVVRRLMEHGSVPAPVHTDWEAVRRSGRGELVMLLPSGAPLDLHWDVINDPEIRGCFTISTEELLRASRDVSLGGVVVRTLSPVDTVLHTALHGCKSGGDRLRWLLDLHQSLLRCEEPASTLLDRARQFRLELLLRTMTGRVTTFVDHRMRVPFPRSSLAERSWLAADFLAMKLFPPGFRWQGGLSGAAVIRSTRAGPRASWAVLSGVAMRRMRRGYGSRSEAAKQLQPSGCL